MPFIYGGELLPYSRFRGLTTRPVNKNLLFFSRRRKMQSVMVDEPTPPPLPEIVIRPRVGARDRKRSPRRTPGQVVVWTASVSGGAGAVAGILLGAILSQFWPLYGWWTYVAEPFSQARLTVLPGHCLLCGLVLGIVAALGGAAYAYLSSDAGRR